MNHEYIIVVLRLINAALIIHTLRELFSTHYPEFRNHELESEIRI